MTNVSRPFGRPVGGPAFVWPAHTGPSLDRKRYERESDGWEQPQERFPAETVLEDLRPGARAEDALVIVARFAALRIAMLASRSELVGTALDAERAAAVGYAAVLPDTVSERRVLREIARTAKVGIHPATRNVANLLVAAAALAERRGHRRGAFALYHAGYDLAVGCGARGEAARAARALAGIAEAEGARRSARLWSRRTRALQRTAPADRRTRN
jgi:hypothetical protein